MRVVALLAIIAAIWAHPAEAGEFIAARGTGTGYFLDSAGTPAGPAQPVDFFAYLVDFGFPPAGLYRLRFFDGTFIQGSSVLGNELSVDNGAWAVTPESARFIAVGRITSMEEQVGTSPRPRAVPEPATWWSMLLGFLSIGTAMRRLRTSPANSRAHEAPARPLTSTHGRIGTHAVPNARRRALRRHPPSAPDRPAPGHGRRLPRGAARRPSRTSCRLRPRSPAPAPPSRAT